MIYIDDRAGSKDLGQYLPRNIPSSLTRLAFGDVMWMGNGPGGCPVPIGIEYKKLGDLVQCITTGRLSGHQLLGLVNEYWRAYLLIEGVWRANPQDGVLEVLHYREWKAFTQGSRRFMAREIWNYLNTLSIMCGVVVWQTNKPEESGEWIAATYRWWEKGWEEHHSHKQFHDAQPPNGVVRLTRPNLVHRVAAQLDGVGYDKGEAIGKRFGSVGELVGAEEKELMEVEGIGKKLAKRIREQLTGAGGQK